MKRFRGGLVFKAHGPWYHSTLESRVIKNKNKMRGSSRASRPRFAFSDQECRGYVCEILNPTTPTLNPKSKPRTPSLQPCRNRAAVDRIWPYSLDSGPHKTVNVWGHAGTSLGQRVDTWGQPGTAWGHVGTSGDSVRTRRDKRGQRIWRIFVRQRPYLPIMFEL